jgi:hypothetical protein
MTSRYIDNDTGEIKYEPDFIKLYIRDVCKINGLTAVQHKMLHFMLLNMNHENLVAYGSIAKGKFLEENNIKATTFNNNIKGLIKSLLIERVSKGEFRVNKKYAVKVDWEKVQSIVWETRYSKCGKVENIKIEETY